MELSQPKFFNQKKLFENPNARLLSIVYKFTKKNFNPLFFNGKTDADLFEYFKQYKPGPGDWNEQRATKRYQDLLTYLNVDQYITGQGNYLDIGCADGMITGYLGKHLGFAESKIYATDIFQPDLTTNVNFIINDEKTIPFNEKFTLVTLFQSLHHMKYLDNMLAEIDRVTDENSYLIIREHNLGDKYHQEENEKLFNLEHAFYEIVYDGKKYEDFVNDFYAKYYTDHEWDIKLEKIGFKRIKKYFIPKFNPTNYYYALYKKEIKT